LLKPYVGDETVLVSENISTASDGRCESHQSITAGKTQDGFARTESVDVPAILTIPPFT